MPGPARSLDAVLAELLAVAGGRSVRLVDGRTGAVVAVAGDHAADRAPDGRPGADDPLTVAALLRDAVALGAGGLDHVAVTTARSVHLLRPSTVAGAFLHLRLDAHRADPDRARRALAAPALHAAVRAALTVASVPRNAGPWIGRGGTGQHPGDVAVPGPRRETTGSVPRNALDAPPRTAPPRPAPPRPAPPRPAPPAGPPAPPVASPAGPPASPVASPAVPRPRPAPFPVPHPARQPALADLVPEPDRSDPGARATVVLAELTDAALPRRRPAAAARPARPAGVTDGLPEPVWARDTETLRRLLEGLRRLS